MRTPFYYFSTVLALCCAAGLASASEETELIRKRLAETFPEVRSEQISPSPIPGLFELRVGAQIAYVSADGRFLVRGDIVETGTERNLTEVRRGAARLAAMDEVGEQRMIVFSPKQVKHTITVFTDIDCGYCRKLHREIDQYLALGIRVRYLFFPRSGPNTESWTKAETVWCSADRNMAMTQSKRGEVLKSIACGAAPVEQHYSLGLSFGLQGTPAIITDSGELLPGYVPAAELARHLDGQKSG
jgi:thiol:disulfide interchange protein DsbC